MLLAIHDLAGANSGCPGYVDTRSIGGPVADHPVHAHASLAAYPSDQILAKVKDLFRLRANGTFQQPTAK